MRISYLPIGRRLTILQLVLSLLFAAIVASAVFNVASISAALTVMNDVNSLKQRYAINFRGSVHDRAISLRDVVLVETNEDLNTAIDEIAELEEFYDQSAGPLDTAVEESTDQAELQILASIKEIESETMPLIKEVIELRRSGARDKAHALLLDQARGKFVTWLARINQFIDHQEAKNQSLGADVRDEASSFGYVMVLTGLVVIGLALALGIYVARSITRPLDHMVASMRALADGDLDTQVPPAVANTELCKMAKTVEVFRDTSRAQREAEAEKSAAAEAERERVKAINAFIRSVEAAVAQAARGDFSRTVDAGVNPEFADLATAINRLTRSVDVGVSETSRVLAAMASGNLDSRMKGEFEGAFASLQSSVNETTERLSTLIRQIVSSTELVGRGGDEITSSAQDLSMRAEQQASSLEQTAATMEEMAASIKSNAQSSATASELAAAASGRADAGGDIVKNAVSAMNEIEASATRIADIISVIDGIAFQTNLLALNAAVEAARAGDAGKGFAVVASEVRALAQRSSEASRDIRQLIETSADQVSEGVKLVTETGASLDGIMDSIAMVEESIKSIAAASVEQSSGIEEISKAVSHMDQLTQQNASVADQSASSAKGLSGEAQKLRELIQFFNVARFSGEEEADAIWTSAENQVDIAIGIT